MRDLRENNRITAAREFSAVLEGGKRDGSYWKVHIILIIV